MIQPTIIPGFGDYSLPEGKSFENIQTAQKVQKIAFLVLYGLAFAGSLFLFPIFWPLALASTSIFAYFTVREIAALIGVIRQAPPCQIFPLETIDRLPQLGELSKAVGITTKDGPDSHAWKLELIRSARRSIVFSGNYCGGRAFDEALDLIAQRMREAPVLTASVLSSDFFLTSENQEKIEEMKKEFAGRFECTVTAEAAPYTSPVTGTLSISSNHVKALVIDYGAYFMLGGTGFVTSWSLQEGVGEPVDTGETHGCLYDSMNLNAYRDMDFVFHSDINGVGTRIYIELTKLLARYGTHSDPAIEPLVPLPIAKFNEANPSELLAAAYATGPEHETNPFLEEMVAAVKATEKTVVIDHMYFHPPQELIEALIDASNRGVLITVITNKLGNRSPGTHLFYAELSRYWAKKLYEGLVKENVEIYEFAIPHTTLHKKVVIADGKTVFLGSANIGLKSLKNHDYEIGLKVDSEPFAAELMRSVEEDKALCEKVPPEEAASISVKTHIFSSVQSLFASFL